MKALARRTDASGYTHRVAIRQHQLTTDEPPAQGGADQGPTPQELLAASLASCTAITLEMYARRKEWDLDQIEVECQYEQAEGQSATRFALVLRLPTGCSEEQVRRLVEIAAKCPVHRTLEREAVFEDRVELIDRPST